MGYDVLQDLGNHEVMVEEVTCYDKDGDGSNYVFEVLVRFANGERGQKDVSTKSPKSTAMARGVLKAMGFDIDTRSIQEIMDDSKLFSGAKLKAVVQENEWNGKVTNRIAFLNAIPKKPTTAGIAKLNQALRMAKLQNQQNEEL